MDQGLAGTGKLNSNMLVPFDCSSIVEHNSAEIQALKIHEFWVDPDGTPMLDDIPLNGVVAFHMWREPQDFMGGSPTVHVRLELVCKLAGPERGRKALEVAFGEAMKAIGED